MHCCMLIREWRPLLLKASMKVTDEHWSVSVYYHWSLWVDRRHTVLSWVAVRGSPSGLVAACVHSSMSLSWWAHLLCVVVGVNTFCSLHIHLWRLSVRSLVLPAMQVLLLLYCLGRESTSQADSPSSAEVTAMQVVLYWSLSMCVCVSFHAETERLPILIINFWTVLMPITSKLLLRFWCSFTW